MPKPLPARLAVNVYVIRSKVAVTLFAASIVMAHVPDPLQPEPVQPVNVEPVLGAAVSVTTVPAL